MGRPVVPKRRVRPALDQLAVHGDLGRLWGRAREVITVRLGGSAVEIDREVFSALFGNSALSDRAPYRKALESSQIMFDDLVGLARKADIPYSLFFAPLPVVEAQLQRKTDKLLTGISKQTFSVNARSQLRVEDVELIVKDLLRKQEELKRRDPTLTVNRVVGCLRDSRRSVSEDAYVLRSALGFELSEMKQATSKQAGLDLLIERFEQKQLLVSQSQRNYMLQLPPREAKFSGLCVRDKKIPYIFLTGGDEDVNPEPAGRKVFTLMLLAILVAHGRFSPVSYSDQTSKPLVQREYMLAEEVLMPAGEFKTVDVSTLTAVKACADVYGVRPSAVTMRVRRLGIISRGSADEYLATLRSEFANRPDQPRRAPRPVNAVRKYAGTEYSRRMLGALDRGALTPGDFCRIVALNKITPPQIAELRQAL
jgi:hypothetical protein